MEKRFNNRENEEIKLPDGRTIWLSRSAAVVAVIFAKKDNDIFVLCEKRSETMEDAPGLWAIPSGYLDWDEDGWDALRREVFEETSFDIDENRVFLDFDNAEQPWYVNTDPKENRQNISMSYILIYDYTDQEFPSGIESFKDKEIDKIEWKNINDITAIKEWAFEHDIRIASALAEFKHEL